VAKISTEFSEALSDSDPSKDEDWKIRLGFLIHDCARLRRIVIDEIFRPLNVTRSQAWMLAYLSRTDGVPQSSLAEQMGLGKVALGGLVDRLEVSEMIERRADPNDRRVNKIFLTERGRQVVKDMRKLTLEANKDILKGISGKDLRTTVTNLKILKHNLKKMQH
jgi:MarR family transcriptional regulator, transcriptional regulator for hemolysin